MTPEQFDHYLLQKKAELISAFKAGSVTDLDVAAKAILDYETIIAQKLFNNFHFTHQQIYDLHSKEMKDSRERYEALAKELKEIKELLK